MEVGALGRRQREGGALGGGAQVTGGKVRFAQLPLKSHGLLTSDAPGRDPPHTSAEPENSGEFAAASRTLPR